MLLQDGAVAPMSTFAAGQTAIKVPAHPLLVRNAQPRYRSSPPRRYQQLLLLLLSLAGSRP